MPISRRGACASSLRPVRDGAPGSRAPARYPAVVVCVVRRGGRPARTVCHPSPTAQIANHRFGSSHAIRARAVTVRRRVLGTGMPSPRDCFRTPRCPTIRFTGRARRPRMKRTVSGVRAPVQPLVGRRRESAPDHPAPRVPHEQCKPFSVRCALASAQRPASPWRPRGSPRPLPRNLPLSLSCADEEGLPGPSVSRAIPLDSHLTAALRCACLRPVTLTSEPSPSCLRMRLRRSRTRYRFPSRRPTIRFTGRARRP